MKKYLYAKQSLKARKFGPKLGVTAEDILLRQKAHLKRFFVQDIDLSDDDLDDSLSIGSGEDLAG